MGDNAANPKGAQRDKRRQRLAKALRRNLKRRKAQARGQANDKPAGETDTTAQKNPAQTGTDRSDVELPPN